MKFSLSWLKEHLDTTADADMIAAKLTAIGLEVESLHNPGAALKPFRTVQILEAEKHPNADRLRVCKVDVGGEVKQIVCGAPNARAGLKAVLGLPGTYVPGIDVTLKLSKIRDVESQGMLCSAKELQLSEESEGIIELPADAPVGVSYAAYARLDDPVFEIKLTPNRADCNGVRGIARDLAAAGLGTLKTQKATPVSGTFESPIVPQLDFADGVKDACPSFIGRFFRNVKNGSSPAWLQERLRSIGLKPVSALVDITNYLSFDAARPLHVFDAAKVKGNIRARMARKGESLHALNGKDYALDESMIVIADDDKPHAIAGIMGDEESGCTETTTDVFLECALFDPARIARAGRALNLTSDARYRFERGVDAGFMAEAVEIASRLILDLCGGEASDVMVAGAPPAPRAAISLRLDRCKTLGGLDVPAAEQKQILETLGCRVKESAGAFAVSFPSWRPDLAREADCVEEILRLKDYDSIPPAPLPLPEFPQPLLTPAQKRTKLARNVLASRGLLETVTYSFLGDKAALAFGAKGEATKILNPISADLSTLRPSILPNLLQAATRNAARGFPDAALFEVGPVYREGDAGIAQQLVAAGLRSGAASPRHWLQKTRAVDAYDAKADVLAVLGALGVPAANAAISADAPSYFHPGRSGVVRPGPNVLAQFGELHPALVEEAGLSGAVTAFDIFLEALPPARETGAARPPVDMPDLQPLTRDFAFTLPRDVDAEKLVRAIKGADKALITEAIVFDVYEGKGVPEGHKSLAVAVSLQPREKSLTDADLEALAAKITAAAAKATGAVLRG